MLEIRQIEEIEGYKIGDKVAKRDQTFKIEEITVREYTQTGLKFIEARLRYLKKDGSEDLRHQYKMERMSLETLMKTTKI
jgi:hypothetical protein